MRIKLFYIVLIIFFGCEASKNRVVNERPELKKTFIEPSDDCIELSKNYESYLGNLKELNNYYWDSKTLTAKIIISESKQLYITLSGCSDVLKECKFIVSKDFDSNINEIKQDFLWISKQLDEVEYINSIEAITINYKLSNSKNNQNDGFIILLPDSKNDKSENFEAVSAFFQNGFKNNSYSIMYLIQ